MPIVEIYGKQVEFPDDLSGDQLNAAVSAAASQMKPQPKPAARPVAQQPMQTPMQAAVRGGISGLTTALQGPSFGFSDEILGGLGAAATTAARFLTGQETDFAGDYKAQRDQYRNMAKKEEAKRPVLSTATQLATGAAVPIPGFNAAKGAGLLKRSAIAGASGLGFGLLSGSGTSEAETASGVAGDAVNSGLLSGGVSAAVPVLGAVTRGVGGQISGRLPPSMPGSINGSPSTYAREKVAEDLVRDTPGKANIENAVKRAKAYMSAVPGAVLADVGDNSRMLLDTQANAPGKSAARLGRVQAERQSTRGDRIPNAAATIFDTKGKGYAEVISDVVKQRSEDAGPYWQVVNSTKVTVDDDLAALLNRSSDLFSAAEKRARLRGAPTNLKNIKPGDQVDLATLDIIRQTAYDAASAAKRSGENGLGLDIDNLRVGLTDKLDNLTTDESGQSFYKAARDLWGGASAYKSAIESGRNAMKSDVIELDEMVSKFDASELDGFKVGVTQSIRDMAGTEAGQTKLINMWKNPATRDKLRIVFGSDYDKFRSFLEKEASKKKLERVGLGRNSMTVARKNRTDDLDVAAFADVAGVAGAANVGSVPGILSQLGNMWGRIQTPEAIRDDIGKILLKGGPEAQAELDAILKAKKQLDERRAATAARAGLWTGLGAGVLSQ